jgi:signal transduction histidine kinase
MEAELEARFLATPLKVSEVASLRRMAMTGRALAIPDTRANPDWDVLPGFEFVRSYAGAPMRLRGLLVGFLNLHSATPGFFTPELADHLQAFADQVAIAIENAHLYGEMDRHTVELEQRVAERTRELAEANVRLTELDRLKDQFISNVSHELRTPLANVKLYLGLLDHGRPEKRDQYMETLHRESGRLANLIEDLLELSRLDTGAAHIHLEPTDLNALTAELIGDRSVMASERGLALDCQIEAAAPMVMGDPRRIMQVMTNLLANAINYTPRGGIITLVTATRQTEEGDWVTLAVLDTGRGISTAELPNLFRRFFRGEASRQSQAPGTGLGLAICKELVEKMEGRITVESQLGRGTAFTVWLKPALRT